MRSTCPCRPAPLLGRGTHALRRRTVRPQHRAARPGAAVAFGLPGGWAPWQPNEIAGLGFAGLLVWTVLSAPKVDGLFATGNVNDIEAAGSKVKSRTTVGRGVIYELEDDERLGTVETNSGKPAK